MYEAIFINNVFQTSDPRQFSLNDPHLKKVFDLLSLLLVVLEMCSNNTNYCFEMFQ